MKLNDENGGMINDDENVCANEQQEYEKMQEMLLRARWQQE
jgi:hypothetical protein